MKLEGFYVFTALFLYVYFAGLWDYIGEQWMYLRQSLKETDLRDMKRG